MKFNAQLPEPETAQLATVTDKGEAIRFCLAGDLTMERRFGSFHLVITSARVVALDDGEIARSLRFEELKEVKVDELFGSARLVAVKQDGEQTLAYYTKALVPEFTVLCRAINDLLKGREPKLPGDEESAYCPRCGCPLPHRSTHCPLCVPKLQVFARLLRFMVPYRKQLALLLVLTFISVGADAARPLVTKIIVDDAIGNRNSSLLLLCAGLLLFFGALRLVLQVTCGSLTAWLSGRVVTDLRARLHATVQRLRMSFFSSRETGEIVGRVMHDTTAVQHFLTDGAPYFLVNSISFLTIAIILICLDFWLALIVFLPVPFLLGGGRWFWQKLVPMFHKSGTRVGRLHSVLNESVQGIKTIKALTREDKRIDQFDNTNESVFNIDFGIERTFLGFSGVMFWIMSLGVTGVWYFGARRIAFGSRSGELTLGVLIAFIGYIWLFYHPLQWFTAVMNWMTHAFASAERVFSILDAKEEVYDAPDAIPLPQIKGAVSFNDVHFSYERGKEVITSASFEIKAGEMIGLIGKSGAGKSTIINLVCRFYDVDSGMISIDGHPIQKVKLRDLRRQIGMVMQEPFLFNASIFENIRSGRPGATFDEVVIAAKAANAHEFVLAEEDGYDTLIGERGAKLSGGEKQRIAIAQAILQDPAILILDEATSSVDSETEKAIQDAMERLVKGRTTIAIAHRLSTLRYANRLIALEDGTVAEIGTHAELLAKDGIFAKLAGIQSELSSLKSEVWKE